MFENVKGLTRSSFKEYFEYIKLRLTHPEVVSRADDDWTDHLKRLRNHGRGRDLGLRYDVRTKLLNAADYGIPQKRERVFIVGFRSDLGTEWEFPFATHTREELEWEKFTGEYWDRNRVPSRQREKGEPVTRPLLPSKPWQTVREAIHDLPDPERCTRKAKLWSNHVFQAGARSYVGHTGSPLDEPAKTLKAGVHGVPGGENMMRHRDGKLRYFTVRECARLQTFPDEFVFHGSWSETMRQLGNAVPVDLAQILADAIRAELNRVRRAAAV